MLDFVRFALHCPPRKRLTDPKACARGRVVLPDEQEAFAQRRLQLADIQIFSGGGMLKGASGYAAMACPAAARTLSAVVT